MEVTLLVMVRRRRVSNNKTALSRTGSNSILVIKMEIIFFIFETFLLRTVQIGIPYGGITHEEVR